MTLTPFIKFLGESFYLLRETIKASITRPFYFDRLIDQIVKLGIGSILISCTIGFVIGLVMTLQFGHGLSSFGGTLYVPTIVSVSLMRELAPIMTALLIAGRVGSGITSEIGSMNVTQQIDAIRSLGTSPIRVLIVPRLLALSLSLPFLALTSGFAGIVGSFIVSYNDFNISYGFFLNKVLEHLSFGDVISGFIKSFFFAIIIVIIASYKSLNTKDGTKGVGESTTWVVVNSSLGILITDFFLTKVLIYFFEI